MKHELSFTENLRLVMKLRQFIYFKGKKCAKKYVQKNMCL